MALNTFGDVMREKARRQLLRQDAEISDKKGRLNLEQKRTAMQGQQFQAGQAQELMRDNTRYANEASQLDTRGKQAMNLQTNQQGFTAGQSQLQRDFTGEEAQKTRDFTSTNELAKDNRNLAAELLKGGTGGQPVDNLYNNDGSFANRANLAEIQPPKQRAETGRYRPYNFTDPEGNVTTRMYDTTSPDMPDQGQQGDAPLLPPDPKKWVKNQVYTNKFGQRAIYDGEGLRVIAQ